MLTWVRLFLTVTIHFKLHTIKLKIKKTKTLTYCASFCHLGYHLSWNLGEGPEWLLWEADRRVTQRDHWTRCLRSGSRLCPAARPLPSPRTVSAARTSTSCTRSGMHILPSHLKRRTYSPLTLCWYMTRHASDPTRFDRNTSFRTWQSLKHQTIINFICFCSKRMYLDNKYW